MKIIKRYKSELHGNCWRALLKYGFYSGLILSFVVIFRKWLVYPLSQPVTYVEEITLLILMFIFVWFYRRKLPEKKMAFKEGYIVAFGTGVVASIIYGIFIMLYAWKIDPEIVNRSFDLQRSLETNRTLTDEQIRYIVKPQYIAFSAIVFSTVLSILWALVVSIIMRTEKATVRTKQI
ncbi:MAG: DUF4199 domain-containing protein [Bacteroidales bacterium]|jgi:hypothetical protein|nr:DUF4199 domain-containing protein [Bacteroidales bacterium]